MGDLACAVVICNGSTNPMNLVSVEQEHGTWSQSPLQTIPPNGTCAMYLNSTGAPFFGPNGSVVYTVTGSNGATGQINFFFGCPAGENNFLDWRWVVLPDPRPNLTSTFASMSGESDWSLNSPVFITGSPVVGVYFVFN